MTADRAKRAAVLADLGALSCGMASFWFTTSVEAGEDDFTRLFGFRNDSESTNGEYKRTLLVDRAMSLGGARRILAFLCSALLHYAVTQHRARVTADLTEPLQTRQALERALRAAA